MAVTNTNNTSAPSSALLNAVNPKGPSTSSQISAEQDKFMTLLITQLKNQDPLNPLDNAQVTSQLAQLNTVTGINKLNDTVESLKADYQASTNVAATNLIGHGVLVPGKALQIAEGKGLLGIELASSADMVTIDIKNKEGTVVHTIEVPNVPAGTLPLVWDGKLKNGTTAPDGNYTMVVKGEVGGESMSSDQIRGLTFGTVASMSTGVGGLKLNVPSVGQVTMDDIKQVL
jgi:flagellar basal-body rod modification protein FlgD